MKFISATLVLFCLLVLHLLAKKEVAVREKTLLQSATFNTNEGIQDEAVWPLLEEKAQSLTNRLVLGYEKLKVLAASQRNSPTAHTQFFVGWDVRPSSEKNMYQLITYAHTNLTEATNSAWVGALASRTTYVRLKR